MKTPFSLLLLSLFILLSTSCLSDIRTEDLKTDGINAEKTEKARAILAKMSETQGLDKYEQFEHAEVVFTDTWPSFINRKAVMPWQKSGEKLQLNYLIGTENSRLIFLEGTNKNMIWGIQNWATYTEEPHHFAIFKQKKKIKFWLPTVQYFMEMAYAIQKAEIVSYAGEKKWEGNTYDLIFASWKTDEPQKEIDQYLLWINQKTGFLEIAQYSIRDIAGFIKGTMTYTDFRDIEGVKIPFRQTASSKPGDKKYLHQFDVQSFKFNPADVKEEDFYPNKEVRKEK